MSKKVLIIGAGGVGRVVVYKCAQHPEVFGEILLASRTKSKCDVIAAAAMAATRLRIDIIRSSPSLVSSPAAPQRAAARSVTTFGVRNTSSSVRFAVFVLVLNRLPR